MIKKQDFIFQKFDFITINIKAFIFKQVLLAFYEIIEL